MGKFHENWDGFIPLRDLNNKICGAECQGCKRRLVKRDSDTLLNHKKYCKRTKNVEALQTRDLNVQSSDSNALLPRSEPVDDSQEVETSNVRLL
ncbi:uncharacterized protein LOC116417189 isoform X2 [Nasonia vitripennis]|uniref:Uncharacterized protein n=1 Tax=Nasonia vitripennis TaxID=7425 RepID=A0A7M7QBC1_NASVI|nr:uncharacterized protein LOC116417189 isoform X2 [Nasonia vitripennis]